MPPNHLVNLPCPGGFAGDARILRSIAFPFTNATGLAFDGKVLWVSAETAEKVYAVDPEDGVPIRMIDVHKACGGMQRMVWDGRQLLGIYKRWKEKPARGFQ